MKKLAVLSLFALISGCAGCKDKPVDQPSYPPNPAANNPTDDKNDARDPVAEPEPAKIPATAKVMLMISRDYAERRVPPPVTTVTISLGSRIYIYTFWQGLQTEKIYSATFRVCPPDKAEDDEKCFKVNHEFATVNKKVNSGDAVYINPLGWMTTVSFNLALADETLGTWRIAVWPTDQDDPVADTQLKVM